MKPDFDEVNQSQYPAVELLVKMGWKYLSREEANAAREGDTSRIILTTIAEQSLARINDYETANGTIAKFESNDISAKIGELENTKFEGLIDTCREISGRIMPNTGGATIRVFEEGSYSEKNVRFIDFKNYQNNDFHVTVEYKLDGNEENLRADIVLFINGVPIAQIENKKSSVGYKQAISQFLRYQKMEYAPKFYAFNQLLIAMDGEHAFYGTAGTPEKFFTNWREKYAKTEELMTEIDNVLAHEMDAQIKKRISEDLNGFVTAGSTRTMLPQDILTYGILRPERILDFVKNFVFYDGLNKKVARYQQYFAIQSTMERINEREASRDGSSRRRGGIIWHTQGSGKSLTMVMFVRALIENPNIVNPRIIIVTDRIDLDKQIKGTFEDAGLKRDIVRVASGAELLERIKNKDKSVLTSLIQKFSSAANKRNFTDTDENIFVLIDEAHRSQSGEANIEMLNVIPNACYIAFTGTPLLKEQKSQKKFGDFIDKYTIDDALQDKVIVPLIYQARYIDLDQNAEQVNRKVDRVMEDASSREKMLVQKKIKDEYLRGLDARIEEICVDITRHYIDKFQKFHSGLKGQVVAPNKKSALAMQKWFEKEGKIKTALVISDESGEIAEDEIDKKLVADYLTGIKRDYGNLKKYEENVIEDFKNNPDGVELLIVVDKLLTGFDAPRDTVLYLAKPLRDHNLLQAIARVNRVYENKDNSGVPKTAGFIIDYSENARSIKTALSLFGNYDEDDVRAALIDLDAIESELASQYDIVNDLFKTLTNKNQHDFIASLVDDEQKRREFGDKLNKLVATFEEYMTLRDTDYDLTKKYQKEIKRMLEIKRSAALQAGERVDLRKYDIEIKRIMNQNITADEAKPMSKEVEITDTKAFDDALADLGSEKSKAEAIAAQTKRVVTETFRNHDDEGMFEKFSDKIQEIIERMRENKISDVEALEQLSLINDDVKSRRDEGLPEAVRDVPGADKLYRNMIDVLKIEKYDDAIVGIAKIVKQNATVDWWKNYTKKQYLKNEIDDYLYDEFGISDTNKIVDQVIELAASNPELYR